MADTTAAARPKPRSVLSHVSRRSTQSGGSGPQMDLMESPKDKKRLNARSDPSRAIREAQPAAVALEECNLESVRAMNWKDPLGNVIADPDKSNPSRSRLERPLDTIRSFEAAVEGTYSNRRSTFIGSPAGLMTANESSRRSSYVGGFGANGNGRYMNGSGGGGGGYYQSGRNYSSRPQSFADDPEGRFFNPARTTRPNSVAFVTNSQTDNFYPGHAHQPSYDTITTAAGSYGTDTRGGTSTDPSSQNSSVDRFQVKPDEANGDRTHGGGYANGPYSSVSPPFNQDQSLRKGANGANEFNGRLQAPFGRADYLNGTALAKPQDPVKNPEQQPPTPIKLDTGTNTEIATATPKKRQSWFKRRFSKKT